MSVFVYGTLMAPEVLQALILRVPLGSPARLRHHRRHALRSHVFPGAVPSPGHSITGLLLRGLTPPELAVFDLFEGEEYEKAAVSVDLLHPGAAAATGAPAAETAATHVYLWVPSLAGELLDEDWDYERFRADHLPRYVKNSASFGVEARSGGGEWKSGGGGGE